MLLLAAFSVVIELASSMPAYATTVQYWSGTQSQWDERFSAINLSLVGGQAHETPVLDRIYIETDYDHYNAFYANAAGGGTVTLTHGSVSAAHSKCWWTSVNGTSQPAISTWCKYTT
jgi:hypothetical protein